MRKPLIFGAALLMFLPGCGGAPTGEVGEETGEASISITQSYVALGDSFAAMGGRDRPLRGEPFCLRSAGNYPELIDASVTDVTCQGAITNDLLHPRPVDGGYLPAQLDALGADTTLVTLSIGGNDIGFGEVAGCVRIRMDSAQAQDCVDLLGPTIDTRTGQLPAKLDQVFEEIHRRAVDAQVVVTGYLPLLRLGHCPELGAVSDVDRQWTVALTTEINRIVTEAAHRHDALFVLPDGAEDHSSCASPDMRWVDIRGVDTDAHPLHLTSAGHEVMAVAVATALRRDGQER